MADAKPFRTARDLLGEEACYGDLAGEERGARLVARVVASLRGERSFRQGRPALRIGVESEVGRCAQQGFVGSRGDPFEHEGGGAGERAHRLVETMSHPAERRCVDAPHRGNDSPHGVEFGGNDLTPVERQFAAYEIDRLDTVRSS